MKKYYNFDKYFESKEEDLVVIHHVLPDEVKKTTGKIIEGMFDEVTAGSEKKMKFASDNGVHTVTVTTTPLDFKYIDEDEPLEMDFTDTVMKKRTYNVKLYFVSKNNDNPEEPTVTYRIDFEPFPEDYFDKEPETEDTENFEDEYEKEQEAEKNINNEYEPDDNPVKIKKWDELDPTGKSSKYFKNFADTVGDIDLDDDEP